MEMFFADAHLKNLGFNTGNPLGIPGARMWVKGNKIVAAKLDEDSPLGFIVSFNDELHEPQSGENYITFFKRIKVIE